MIKKKFLILIPARSGSSKLKNKNIKLINKRPLLYYTCKFAKKLKGKNSTVIGCTDSKKISKIFNKFDIQTPFLRPKKISKKFSLDIEFVNYSLKFFANKISIGSFVLGRNGLCPLDSFKFFFFLEKMLQKLTLYVSTFLSFYASS